MPSIGHISYFYPRSPCGERLDVNNPVAALTSISIHALLAESDCYSLRHSAQGRYFYPRSPCGERHQPVTMHTWRKVFLSTLSLRRATARPRYYSMGRYISIHALLAESDHSFSHAIIILVLFLSTLSLRRATVCVAVQSPASRFLSTLSLRRATRAESGQQRSPHNFYPRSPCGERLFVVLSLRGDYVFLSTLSLRRAT